jgi:hypothetical protein
MPQYLARKLFKSISEPPTTKTDFRHHHCAMAARAGHAVKHRRLNRVTAVANLEGLRNAGSTSVATCLEGAVYYCRFCTS